MILKYMPVCGRLTDAHESLRKDDYALLDWTLARTQPKLVTLEHYREDRAALRQMLVRLRERLDAAGASGLE